MKQDKFIPAFLLMSLALIWGSSFILMSLGLRALDPWMLAGFRLTVAALCLSPFLFRYFHQVRREDWKYLAFCGIIGNGIPAYLFAASETVVPSGQAGILNSLSPLFVVIASRIFFGARFPFIKTLGILLGFSGALIITAFSGKEIDFGEGFQYSLLIVLATVFYGISASTLKYKLGHANPLQVSAFTVIFAGIPSAILLFGFTDFTSVAVRHPEGYMSVFYIFILGAAGTALAQILFNRLLKYRDVVYASSVTYLMPVIALGWGYVFHEELRAAQLMGLVLIIAGVYLMSRKNRTSLSEQEAE